MTENNEIQKTDPLLPELEARIEEVKRRLAKTKDLQKIISPGKSYGKWGPDAASIYIVALALTGRRTDSAGAAGVCYKTIMRARDKDEDFAEAEKAALEAYQDRIRKAVEEEAIDGREAPIILRDSEGSQHIAGYQRIRDTKLLAVLAKSTLPEWREKTDINVSGEITHGVLAIPTAAKNNEEFEAKFGGPVLDPPIVRKVENTATKKEADQ